MTTAYEAPGLTADWLNGWLAAIGVTVAVPGVKLSWSDDAVPNAVFHLADGVDLPNRIAAWLPTEEALRHAVIARSLPECVEFPRTVSLAAYRQRAVAERRDHSFHVAASVSDLRGDVDLGDLEHGAFDPSAPQGKTLWERAVACARAMPADRSHAVRGSLTGQVVRVQANGLGFDPRRLAAGVQATGNAGKVHVDPVVELLCFGALALFPTRGDGRRVVQRGWVDRSTRTGSFRWEAWRPELDRWAIDAFLDLRQPADDDVVARFRVVPYQPSGKADRTRAYFAERLP